MSPRLGPAMAAVSVALIALGVDVQATTCIVVATTRQIVIATDGLQVSTDGRRSSVCKIGGSSTLGYTLAGLAGANTGFDAQRMAQQIATTHTSALSAMAAFRDQVAPEIARIVTAAKASSAGGRADYQRWTELHVPVIQAFFGSLTNGHTEAEVCTFLLDVSGDLKLPACEQYNGVTANPDAVSWFSIGFTRELPAGWNQSPDLAATAFTSPIPLLKRLIGIESRARPNDVGPPIAIAVIDAPVGLHFVEQGGCQLVR